VGDEYKMPGQVGGAGEHTDVHNNTFNQYINPPATLASPPALHQIPLPSADFVGREKEIKELLQALETGGIAISGLLGLGGVGKTALALKLAEHLKPKYPDAQVYLDLKGASPHPLTATEAMAHVIRGYHPTAQLPENESSLRGLYLSVLEGKKNLLLMDNAANAEQVKPLIPPAGSIMLVTSRNHFRLGGFFVKHLDTLQPEDAEKLLLKIEPRIDKCAAKIAELCGYLPLALEVAASTFHISVSLTPEAYVKRFSDTTKRMKILDEVTTSLSLSYELLDEEMQKLWRVLSVFPTTFDAEAVAALWEMEVEEATDNVDRLISYSLVEWNETTRRYRLHDLVRLFAEAKLQDSERLAARKAHASYFRDLLAQADKLYLQGGGDVLVGLSLFDKERENIEVGQSWSASLIGKDDTATELSMHYYFAGAYVLELRLHPREKIAWLEVTLKAARLLGNKWNVGAALGNLGLAYADFGETRKAIEFYEQRIVIAREVGDRRGEGIALGNLGNAYADFGETRKAIEFYEQHLVITREIDYRRGEGNALGNLGNAYAALGETRKAIEFYEQRLEIAREVGDRRGEGNALGNLGVAYKNLGEPQKAIEFYEQQLVITREIGDRRGESTALGNLGNAYRALGETRKAIKFYEQNLEIAREIGDHQGEGIALWNSALVYDELGDRALAISLAEMALAIREQIESPLASKVRSTLDSWKAEKG
jgi:tetratricopeptide (TPR) repeat protein